jgi:hypothetical protein
MKLGTLLPPPQPPPPVSNTQKAPCSHSTLGCRMPLWVSARMITKVREIDFYLFLNTKQKSLPRLIRCHLKIKELCVLSSCPKPTDS